MEGYGKREGESARPSASVPDHQLLDQSVTSSDIDISIPVFCTDWWIASTEWRSLAGDHATVQCAAVLNYWPSRETTAKICQYLRLFFQVTSSPFPSSPKWPTMCRMGR